MAIGVCPHQFVVGLPDDFTSALHSAVSREGTAVQDKIPKPVAPPVQLHLPVNPVSQGHLEAAYHGEHLL